MDTSQMIITGIMLVFTGVITYTIGHFNGFMKGMNKCQSIYSPNTGLVDGMLKTQEIYDDSK